VWGGLLEGRGRGDAAGFLLESVGGGVNIRLRTRDGSSANLVTLRREFDLDPELAMDRLQMW
jgi:hypothetical protein